MSTIRANTITDTAGGAPVFSGGVKTNAITDTAGGNTVTVNGITPVSEADAVAAAQVYMFGIGQAWVDVLASRAVSTNYQNTTGRPIVVAIRFNGGGAWVQVSANASAWVNVANSGQNSEYLSVSFVVPNGWYYRVNGAVSGLSMWSELR